MIADPNLLTEAQAERWLKDIGHPSLADYLSGLVAQTSFARSKADAWRGKTGEWVGRAGWGLVGRLARSGADLPDDYWRTRLDEIEAGIHKAPNRVREAMNSALIAIGGRSAALEKAATAAAKRIGPVEIDHGDTNCKTPDAVEYIQKARARKRAGK